jgi:hypothetical protein
MTIIKYNAFPRPEGTIPFCYLIPCPESSSNAPGCEPMVERARVLLFDVLLKAFGERRRQYTLVLMAFPPLQSEVGNTPSCHVFQIHPSLKGNGAESSGG